MPRKFLVHIRPSVYICECILFTPLWALPYLAEVSRTRITKSFLRWGNSGPWQSPQLVMAGRMRIHPALWPLILHWGQPQRLQGGGESGMRKPNRNFRKADCQGPGLKAVQLEELSVPSQKSSAMGVGRVSPHQEPIPWGAEPYSCPSSCSLIVF